MNKPSVSIIVPVYNTSSYLKRCLDSLLKQTLKEIEIICVNDGSTDDSLSILMEYSRKDPRIFIVSQVNLGRGATYNAGLNVAQGKYIAFLDSDDFVKDTMYDEMVKIINLVPSLDFIKSNSYIAFYGDHQEIVQTIPPEKCNNLITDMTQIPELVSGHVSHWCGLYNREFLKKNNIHFNDKQKYVPDISFMYRVWLCAKKAIIISKPYVFYQKDRNGSAVQSKSHISFAFLEEYQNITQLMEKQKNISKKIWRIKAQVEFKHLCFEWGYRCDKQRWRFLKKMSFLFKINLKRHISLKKFGLKNRLFYFFVAYFPLIVFLNDKCKFWVAYYGYNDVKKYRFFGLCYSYSTQSEYCLKIFGIPFVHRYDYIQILKNIEQNLSMLQQKIMDIRQNMKN